MMSETPQIEIGRLLRASTNGCVVGCKVNRINAPTLGGLVRIPLQDQTGLDVIGIIYDMHIDDDGLVRQLIGSENISEEVILDNRNNRNVPVEISVLFLGYVQDGRVQHLLPPRPPLTLDAIYPCTADEIIHFTNAGRLGYIRHILRAQDLPVGELIAAHISQAEKCHLSNGDPMWVRKAVQELVVLLRDDYAALMAVLSALADAGLTY